MTADSRVAVTLKFRIAHLTELRLAYQNTADECRRYIAGISPYLVLLGVISMFLNGLSNLTARQEVSNMRRELADHFASVLNVEEAVLDAEYVLDKLKLHGAHSQAIARASEQYALAIQRQRDDEERVERFRQFSLDSVVVAFFFFLYINPHAPLTPVSRSTHQRQPCS